jgi:hypothetical protein
VLEEVREAGFARLFVLGADVIPDVDRDDRRFVILVDEQREPVRQHELGEWNARDRDNGFRRRLNRRRRRLSRGWQGSGQSRQDRDDRAANHGLTSRENVQTMARTG